MPEEKFRLPQSSYEEVAKIIMAYGYTDQPSVPADIGSMAGMHQTIVSSNNAFLLSIGIIEGGKKKVMTSRVGQPLSVPTIWVAYPCGFVLCKGGAFSANCH
jgi:hypothetical protein